MATQVIGTVTERSPRDNCDEAARDDRAAFETIVMGPLSPVTYSSPTEGDEPLPPAWARDTYPEDRSVVAEQVDRLYEYHDYTGHVSELHE